MRHGVLLLLVLALACGGEESNGDAEGCGDESPAPCGCGCAEPENEPPPAETRNTHMQYSAAAVDVHLTGLAKGDDKARGMALMSIPTDPRHFEQNPELIAKVRDALVDVALNDPKDFNRGAAIGKVMSMGEHAVPAMPRLLKTLDHQTDCSHFCHNLRHMGEHGAAAVPRLVELLKTGPETSRVYYLDGLGNLGPTAAPAVPALIDLLKNAKNKFQRVKAAHALGKIGAAARDALPTLDELAKTGPGNVKFACGDAAKQIRGG